MHLSVRLVREELKAAVELAVAYTARVLVPARYAFTKRYDNTILYVSHKGLRTDCNPRAIYEYLQKAYPGKFEHIWVVKNPDAWEELAKRESTRLCKRYTFGHVREAFLSRVVISNTRAMPMLPGNRKQVFIGTWHGGGCYKHFAAALEHNGPIHNAYYRLQARCSDYYLSSSALFTKHVLREGLLFDGDILPWGMPRNDRLIQLGNQIDMDARTRLGIPKTAFLVTYAPTWLESNETTPRLDVAALRSAVARRFGEEVLVARRAHHRYVVEGDDFDLDLGGVEDVQDVLAVSDMLISDYSSIIWDFSFTYRPCLLFTPNLDEYERDFGFFKDIHEWGFPVCGSMDELVARIEAFNQNDFEEAMKAHHDDLGSYESGRATEQVADLIRQICLP